MVAHRPGHGSVPDRRGGRPLPERNSRLRGPVGVQAIPPQEPTEGDGATILNLNDFFTDLDEDILTYALTEGAMTGVAAIEVDWSTLSITPLTDGAGLIDVTASDPSGLSETFRRRESAVGMPLPPAPEPIPHPALYRHLRQFPLLRQNPQRILPQGPLPPPCLRQCLCRDALPNPPWSLLLLLSLRPFRLRCPFLLLLLRLQRRPRRRQLLFPRLLQWR